MDVAGVALALVVLGHERQGLAVLSGDLLGAVLVDGVVVGGSHHLVVLEGDLVLAEVALALGRLDHESRAEHAVADVAQERLDPAGAEQGVVDVVLVGRREAAIGARPGLLVGVVEDDELELGAGKGGQALLGGPLGLRLEDLPGALGDRRVSLVQPGQVAHHHRRAGQPGHRVQRVEVEGELHVAVAALPGADRVAVDGVHVHVDREQVVAALGAVLQHGVQEELGMHRACPGGAPACRGRRPPRCR